MLYVAWAVLLIAQNFTNAAVGRAHASGSLSYHGVAKVLDNGMWFACQVFLVGALYTRWQAGDAWYDYVMLGLFYNVCALTGAISSHYILMRWVERGKRKVGA